MNEIKELTGYVAQSGTYGRYRAQGKEYISIQFEYCPNKDNDVIEKTPVMLMTDRQAKEVGIYFLKQSFINLIRNLFKK